MLDTFTIHVLLQLLRVASASQSLEEGSTPGRHCAAEDGRVEASTTLESQCSHLNIERYTHTNILSSNKKDLRTLTIKTMHQFYTNFPQTAH